jgi:hypothetical protein
MTETAAQKKARLAKEAAANNKDTFKVNLPALNSSGSSTSISSVDLSTSEFDATGLVGLKFPAGVNPTKVNGIQFYNALVKAAIDSPSIWLPIKYALAQSNFYSSTPSFTPGWNENDDGGAVKSFLSTLVHKNSDLATGEAKTPVVTFLSQTQNLAKLYGGAAARTQVQKVTVPNPLDLQKIADTAFRSALGFAPTLKQKNDFVKSYTQQVMAVARASAASTAAPTAAPSMGAIQGAMTPAATPAAAMASIQKNASTTPKQPSMVMKQVQQAPDPSLAAEQMAIASNPAAAASQSVDNALTAMFASLQRNANG